MTGLKPRSAAALVLYDGDDQEELALLHRAAAAAVRDLDAATAEQAKPNARHGGEDIDGLRTKADEAKAAFDEFVDAAAERAVEVRVRSIGRTPFRTLMADHPPRMVDVPSAAEGEPPTQRTHDDDAGFDVNTETFPMALLTYRENGVNAVCAPEFADTDELQAFLDHELNDGDFDELWVTAYQINRNPSADPSRFRFSVDSQSSTETDA